MSSAMYAGISGINVNQKKLDVNAHNIANSSTTAYKSERATFKDAMSQTISQASSPTNMLGGVNAVEIGLGAQLSGVDTNVTPATLQPTSNNTDFGINGSGYFVVAKGTVQGVIPLTTLSEESPIKIDSNGSGTLMTDIKYTRDGSFHIDGDGSLLNASGYRVMGYALKNDTESEASVVYSSDSSTPTVNYVNASDPSLTKVDSNLRPLVIPKTIGGKAVSRWSVDSNGVIKAVMSDNTVSALGQISMVTFSNDAGLSKAGGNLYDKSSNSGEAIFRESIVASGTNTNEAAYGGIEQSKLEMSNVDLAEQFTDMIVASRAFQANGKIITTSDELLQDLVNLKR